MRCELSRRDAVPGRQLLQLRALPSNSRNINQQRGAGHEIILLTMELGTLPETCHVSAEMTSPALNNIVITWLKDFESGL